MKKYNLQDLLDRFEEDGVEYTVVHYLDPESIADTFARALANEVRDAIKRLNEYVVTNA